ncbi:MAG: hypothetical protein LW875_11980 [Proteobacteria bacterium]|nr:hypothetical protein [Pseudomonadota bacterium]
MKSVLMSALVVMSMGFYAHAEDQGLPPSKDVEIMISDAFVPGGFDSESDAYIVASGIFPNGCYTWKQAMVTNRDSFNHDIKSVASVSQGMCLMVLVPFTKEIRLGKLDTGKHTIRFLNGDGTYLEKTMTVE